MATGQKLCLKLRHVQLVLDSEVAMKMFSLLAGDDVEVFDSEWDSVNKDFIRMVRPVAVDELELCVMSKEQYAMGKMQYKSKQTKEK